MPSKQSEAVRRHWEASHQAMVSGEQRDDEAWGNLTAEPRGVDYLETTVTGLRAMWAVPHGCAEDRVLLCMHGGGFVSGSIYTHRKLFAHLAKAVGARALIFEYSLVPATHPAQVTEAARIYWWLLDQGIRHVAFAGDSAGGGLVITTQLRARELGLPMPAAVLPFSPWVDLEVTGESYATNRVRDPFFHAETVRELAGAFLGPTDPRDPTANPLYAELAGLAPTYIQVGGHEALLDDARRLAERAGAAGVEVRLDVFPEMLHTFQMAAGRAPEADDAIRRMADWLRPKLD
ncbi:alpha/beta hydrolase [Actinophytocola sp.]|uniref:alpha/beta hydrolase n=1 Tax=Actinophytocola sp. TaxID=1872138 RepID=UPI00389A1D21